MASFKMFLVFLLSYVIRSSLGCETKVALSCEHEQLIAQCPSGKLIRVIDANYGRTRGGVCTNGPIQTTSCRASNSLATVSNLCNNKQSCAISASNSVFGDPCFNTFKYLEVSYCCEESKCLGSETQSVTACENTNLAIKCPKDSNINILSANYGRVRSDICTGGPIRDTNCRSSNSLSIVSSQCNNKESCDVSASNNVFGDPCYNTFKYLEVSYCCPKPEPTTEEPLCNVYANFSCGGAPMTLSCKQGCIKVLYSNLGRTTTDICPYGNMANTNCYLPVSTDLAKEKCDGRKVCEYTKWVGFSDPCFGTWKYLEVIYSCNRKCKNCRVKETCDKAKMQAVACSEQTTVITCPQGTINILDTNYGRTTKDVCPDQYMDNLACYAQNSKSIVTNNCQGKTTCSLLASASIYGDPCFGTTKYLQVSYSCIPKCASCREIEICGNVKMQAVKVACSEKTTVITCSQGTINILDANYGRTTKHVCPDKYSDNLACYAQNSTSIVTDSCQGKTTCSLLASASIYGDPCFGTTKYLQVLYSCNLKCEKCQGIETCDKKPTKDEKVACSEKTMVITCSEGTINILNANYGRTSKEVCPDQYTDNLACYAENSTSIVIGSCQGLTTCTLWASATLYGDPCYGTSKYLRVSYSCNL